ncbi:hypothetical protein NO2_0239 [Candidatus Termititenax persephonae]|uniref:Uncharacterized protein n=1 Tax=Candidatus Termititenax persephonae TaxID=2218525 RepID=A0A388TEW1_9BACT|nr:hypothetical protein NO2_0239 [Candidatus Termititenax persephonae]
MKEIKALLLLLGILFLSGCNERSFVGLTLDTAAPQNKLKLEVRYARAAAQKTELETSGEYQTLANPLDFFETDVHTVWPDDLTSKLKMTFSDGIFLVGKGSKTYGLDAEYISQHRQSGEWLKFQELNDDIFEATLPFEKITDPDELTGIIILVNSKMWWEWIDPTNVLHDDSNFAKAIFVPISNVKEDKNKKGLYHITIEPAKAKDADIGDGMIFLAFFSFDYEKTRGDILNKVIAQDYPCNWGSNFLIPFGGLFNTNHAAKTLTYKPKITTYSSGPYGGTTTHVIY